MSSRNQMMRSLKFRLLAGLFCTTTLVFVLFGIVIYGSIKQALIEEFDSSLLSVARTLATSAEFDEGRFEFEFDAQYIPEFQQGTGVAYFQFWMSAMKVLKRSPSLEDSNLTFFHGDSKNPDFRYCILPNGKRARAIGMKFECRRGEYRMNPGSDSGNSLILVVAKETNDMDKKVRFVRWLLFIAGTLILMISLLITGIVVRSGLRPLDSLGEHIALIREDLSARISSSGMSIELEPIVNKLNELLVRIESAFIRERSFTADVAHELRTPLAGIRSTLEVALLRERSAEEYKEALKDTLEIATHLQSMVNNLLLLARFDTGVEKLSNERIPLSSLIDSCWKQYTGSSHSRNIVFDNRIPPHHEIVSNLDMVTLVMSVLLENASKHTNNNGNICVSSTGAAESIEIVVSNSGCTLTPESIDHVFDRFWRGDSSRSQAGEHFGLGLSLAHRAVSILGGRISASVKNNGVFSVSVIFPTV